MANSFSASGYRFCPLFIGGAVLGLFAYGMRSDHLCIGNLIDDAQK
jgi:hypothetical protein